MPGKCRFNNVWLHLETYKTWLEKVQDPRKARCGLCSKIIDISNMGESALASHAKGAKHQAVVAAREGSSMTITSFFSPPSTSTDDFVTATGCSTSMLKFCKHRWVENLSVAERGMQLWPHVKRYVEMVGRGELPNPKVKSFEEVKNRCADPLFTVKVGIFISIAREIEPFLTMYQTDQPMLPFLAEDMTRLIKGKLKH
ncbi:hypothetical protein PO909_008670 [Leuciscus waleckii]